ncbi:hypothetical protein [Methylobacterium nonmethylotrophicum]|uniref:Uncharacterized protein n=1 Tax=Methylobacterium nonmethylotrophicum TaxID=1141884 RepID=A0A4Z0NQ93_9HYPH|nr:hypothetical protein [Methylobacterium nonmethylotrophicum]TGD99103.1 hypothetical protein EU555_14490 [Methylobacterium nonmethylotrophicum]
MLREKALPLILGVGQSRNPGSGSQLVSKSMRGSYELARPKKPTDDTVLWLEENTKGVQAIGMGPKRLKLDVIIKVLACHKSFQKNTGVSPVLTLPVGCALVKLNPIPHLCG